MSTPEQNLKYFFEQVKPKELEKSFREVKKTLFEMETGVYDFTDNGKCKQCGACCGSILPLSNAEIMKIRNYITKHGIKEQKKCIPFTIPIFDLTCPFLDDSKDKEKCKIYPVRPQICRSFSCNPNERHKGDKILYENLDKYKSVDMREVFFGTED